MYTMNSPAVPSTQSRIFAAARALFDQEGEEGISMRRIAALVGITPMAIYKHYPDKDAILNALMLDGFAAWEARVEGLQAGEPLAWLREMTEAFADFALQEPRRYQAAFLLKASGARKYPQDMAQGRSPVIAKVMAQIEAARASGKIGDFATMDMAISLVALVQGLVDMYGAGRFSSEAEFRTAYGNAVRHCMRSFTEKFP